MSEAPWTDEERAAAVAYLEKWEAAEQVKQGRGIRWLCLCGECGKMTTAEVIAAVGTVRWTNEKGRGHTECTAIVILCLIRGRVGLGQQMEPK